MLVGCATVGDDHVSGAQMRQCFKANSPVSQLKSPTAKTYSDFASICQSASRTDVRPSLSSIALFNGSQLYRYAADASEDLTQKTSYLGQASTLGKQALETGFEAEGLALQLALLQSAYGSDLELGLMPNAQRACTTKIVCLTAGLDGLARQGGDTVALALTNGRKPIKVAAAHLQILEARATSELVRLRGQGSVHIALEKLQNVVRQIDTIDQSLAANVQNLHSDIAIRHADYSIAQRNFSDAIEHLKQAVRFSQERSADLNMQGNLQIMLGEAQILNAAFRQGAPSQDLAQAYCEAANSFQAASRSSDRKIRAQAQRGQGFAYAKISNARSPVCLASRQSALAAYQSADDIDADSKLPRAHYETFSDLLSDTDPAASLALDFRRGGQSRLDALYGVGAPATIPRRVGRPVVPVRAHTSTGTIPNAPPSVSTWSLSRHNTRARNHINLARQRRQASDVSGAVAQYNEAISADGRWPLAALELGELQIQYGAYDRATEALNIARDIAQADLGQHGQAFATVTYLQGRNELLRYGTGVTADLGLALSASRESANNSVELAYKYQACLAALTSVSMAREDIRLCDFSGSRTEDGFFAAFGQIRKMQITRRAMDADFRARQTTDETYRQKQRAYERAVDLVESSFQTLLVRPSRTTQVALPVTQSRFSVEDYARMGLYLGEACQNQYKEAPAISRNPQMLALFQMLKLDSCDAS
jgi:predicted negative regulator of RcsB-dependent stress response